MKAHAPGDGRQRILDVAEAMFTERGFKDASCGEGIITETP